MSIEKVLTDKRLAPYQLMSEKIDRQLGEA